LTLALGPTAKRNVGKKILQSAKLIGLEFAHMWMATKAKFALTNF